MIDESNTVDIYVHIRMFDDGAVIGTVSSSEDRTEELDAIDVYGGAARRDFTILVRATPPQPQPSVSSEPVAVVDVPDEPPQPQPIGVTAEAVA